MCVVAVHQHFKKLERIYCLFYSYTHVRCFLVVCYQFTAFLHKCIANRVWPPERGKKEKETIIENEEMYYTGPFVQSIFCSVWFEGVFQRSVGIPSLCEVCDAAPRTVDGGRKSRFHHKAAGSCGMWRG